MFSPPVLCVVCCVLRCVSSCIRPVGVGEELTHSYIDPMATTASRRQKLLATYCFECDCAKCAFVPVPRAPSYLAIDREYELSSMGSVVNPAALAALPVGDPLKAALAAADQLCVFVCVCECECVVCVSVGCVSMCMCVRVPCAPYSRVAYFEGARLCVGVYARELQAERGGIGEVLEGRGRDG